MAEQGYVDERDRDCVAFLIAEAAAFRQIDPARACALARAAKAIADQRHRVPSHSQQLPDFESGLPTHEERLWGADIDERILARLEEWITREVER